MVDANELRQTLDSAEVVAVPVRRSQVVEVIEPPHILEDAGDPLRVAIVEPRPPRIDQKRFALGRDDQGRRTPHHVDEINVERLRRAVGSKQKERAEGQGKPTWSKRHREQSPRLIKK